MFFPRLRRRARWVFALIAVAFALAFVVAGVGTGFGSGFGDYLSDLLNIEQGGPSAGDARERLEKNPRDAEALEDLLAALTAEGKTNQAISELERYTKVDPRNVEALQQLAGLYSIKAGEAAERAEAARLEAQQVSFGQEMQDPNSRLAKHLGGYRIQDQIRTETQARAQSAGLAAQDAYRKEAAVWQKLTTLRPDEASFFQELGRSSVQAADYSGAIVAYQRYLELSPDAADARQIRALIDQLKAQAAVAGG